MSVFIFLFILFLSVIGLVDLMHSLQLALLNVKNSKCKVVCCLLCDENAEMNLRYVIEQQKWLGQRYADRIVAVNYLSDTHLAERCKKIAEGFDIPIISADKLHNFLDVEN